MKQCQAGMPITDNFYLVWSLEVPKSWGLVHSLKTKNPDVPSMTGTFFPCSGDLLGAVLNNQCDSSHLPHVKRFLLLALICSRRK